MDGCVIYPLWSHFLFSKSCFFYLNILCVCGFGLFEFVRVLFWVFFQSIINAGYIFFLFVDEIFALKKITFFAKSNHLKVKKSIFIKHQNLSLFVWIDQVVMSWCCFLQLSFNYYHWKKRSSQQKKKYSIQ